MKGEVALPWCMVAPQGLVARVSIMQGVCGKYSVPIRHKRAFAVTQNADHWHTHYLVSRGWRP